MKPGAAILGRLDCIACGTKDGVRVTHDKNGDPFGYCDATCGQQYKFGGSPHRVKLFTGRHPWAVAPVPVTDAGAASAKASAPPPATPKPVPVTAAKPEAAPVTVTPPKPAEKAGPFDFLMRAKA